MSQVKNTSGLIKKVIQWQGGANRGQEPLATILDVGNRPTHLGPFWPLYPLVRLWKPIWGRWKRNTFSLLGRFKPNQGGETNSRAAGSAKPGFLIHDFEDGKTFSLPLTSELNARTHLFSSLWTFSTGEEVIGVQQSREQKLLSISVPLVLLSICLIFSFTHLHQHPADDSRV